MNTKHLERIDMPIIRIGFVLLSVIFSSMFVSENLAVAADEVDVRTQELVGTIVSIDQEASSFDLEFEKDDPSRQKGVLTFFVTDISTIDIAMAQGSLEDLKPGLKVLVEFAPMPDGTNVVESVWVKK